MLISKIYHLNVLLIFFELPTSNFRLPTSDFRLATSDLRLPDFRPPTSDFRLPTSDLRPPTSDFRLPTSDLRPPTSDFRLPTSDFRLPTSDFRPPTSDWELLSEVNYFHSFSMEEDPLLMKEICDAEGIKVGSLSGHSPLMKPEAAIPRLTRAIVLASEVGAKFVNTDEMVKPDWMTDEEAHQVMYYTLRKVEMVARRHGIYVCIEPHGIYTKTAAGLLKIVNLVKSPWIRVNWDTGTLT
jgi:hypothetical protein